MSKKFICTIIGLVLLTSANSFSQDKIKLTKKVPRNSWSLGLNYGENGFGPYVFPAQWDPKLGIHVT